MIDEKALQEASAKLRKLRLTSVGGRKERPAETVKSVFERGLGGMYDDEVITYALRHAIQYYQAAEQTRAPDVAPQWRCKCGWANFENVKLCSACGTQRR